MESQRSDTPAQEADGASVHPAGFCQGQGLIVVYGNAAFQSVFGPECVGLPAREGMVGLSRDAFTLMDAVLSLGRPASRWVRLNGRPWRLVVAPRTEMGSGETYGVAFHLRPRDEASGVAPADGEEAGEGAPHNRKRSSRSRENLKQDDPER